MSDKDTTRETEEAPSDDDQREYERVGVNAEFKSIDAFLTEYVSDISRGGVFIRSKTPLDVGTRVELRFTIIIEDVETIEGEGEVVRTEDAPNPGMGVRFTKLTPESRDLIDRLVERRNALERSVVVVDEEEPAPEGDAKELPPAGD